MDIEEHKISFDIIRRRLSIAGSAGGNEDMGLIAGIVSSVRKIRDSERIGHRTGSSKPTEAGGVLQLQVGSLVEISIIPAGEQIQAGNWVSKGGHKLGRRRLARG